MVDCFVSSFRINYRNNQHFDICLQPNSPIIYHLVYVKGTYAIVKEVQFAVNQGKNKLCIVVDGVLNTHGTINLMDLRALGYFDSKDH